MAFDFDGTLTVRDSFTAFLRWRTPPLRMVAGLMRLAPAGLAYLVRRDRGRLKAASVQVFLGDASQAELEAEASAFCAQCAAMLLRPDALAVWEAHGAQGDVRVIVTASPEILVTPFAARLAADALIGTRLAFDADGGARPGLDGPNCRGPEKVRRLRDHFGEHVMVADAYGDTAGDLEMLAFAERGHMRVFHERPRADPGVSRA